MPPLAETTFLERPPVLEDAPAISALVQSVPALDTNSPYAYVMLCDQFDETCVVIERDGRVVGFLSALPLPKQADTLFVWQIAVAREARGCGAAGRMLDDLITRPAFRGRRWIEATITTSNEASRALFRSFGRRHGVAVEETPHYSAELLGGPEAHESEDLFRIGPFPTDG